MIMLSFRMVLSVLRFSSHSSHFKVSNTGESQKCGILKLVGGSAPPRHSLTPPSQQSRERKYNKKTLAC